MRVDGLVEPLFERESDSVPGPFYVVKNQCILCALPPETAPKNIQWDEKFQRDGWSGCPNHCRVVRQPETPAEAERLIEAAISSCVEAIRYVELVQKFLLDSESKLTKDYATLYVRNKTPRSFLARVLCFYNFHATSKIACG
jgi:hypothetical protein